MNDVEPIARLMDALDPWRESLVVVGGWAHRLHRFVPGVQVPPYEPLRTKDADIAFSTLSALTGDMAGALKQAGFKKELTGDHKPPVTWYRLGDQDSGFYAEFLAPLFGNGMRRDGTEDATVLEAGVTAQKLRYLDLLLIEPISVDLSSANGIPTQKAISVRVANPVAFIAQKLLIRTSRIPDKQAQDILYVHDTLELFSAELDALQAMWNDRLKPKIHSSTVKKIEDFSRSQFAQNTDAIRKAALIAPWSRARRGKRKKSVPVRTFRDIWVAERPTQDDSTPDEPWFGASHIHARSHRALRPPLAIRTTMTDVLAGRKLAGVAISAETLFSGPGEMRALCRSFDWRASHLGPVEQWSPVLRATVQMVLAISTPTLLFWGPQLVQVFNDAFRPSLGSGEAHRNALGAPGATFWAEVWPTRGPQIAQVLAGHPPALHTDICIPMTREGRMQDVWWTYSDTPVFGDDGQVAGVLVLCQETTARVEAERRQVQSEQAAQQADHRAARILEQVADEHLTMDAAFRILTINAAAARALSVPRASLIGQTHWDAFPASVGSIAETHYRHAMRERVHVHFAHRYVGEGYDRHLEIDVYPTDDGGLALFWRDVSSRVHAEHELHEVTERYRVLFQSVQTGFAIIDLLFDADGHAVDYLFVDVNDAFVTQTGLQDAVGRSARTLVPELESVWIDTYARVAATGESVHFEQGSAAMGRWFDVSAVRVGPAAARRVALLFRDVSAQRAANAEREALLESVAVERQRLEEVFRQAPAFLAVYHGPQHVFEFANDAYYQLVGHRHLVGKPVFEALPDARDQGFEVLLDDVLATGVPFIGRDVPVRLTRTPDASPEEIFMDLTCTPLRAADGRATGIIVHGVDVTAQVRAREQLAAVQQQLRTFADAIPTLAWTARADGYIDWYNAQWFAYTGTVPADMEGWGWQMVHDEATLPAVLERWSASIETGQPFEMTFPLRGADGTFQSFLTRVVPSHDATGAVVRWFGTNTNVEQEQRLRRAAEQANRAKSEFLAVMSHELRTPLNAIDGYAQLMELGVRGPVTGEQRQDLARIRKSEQHLLGLINGILNYAQIDAGAVQYELDEVLIDEVLTSCEVLTSPQMRTKKLIFCRYPCAPDLRVHVDREKLQQIVLNLLSNAIKFTEPGGSIELRCVSVVTEGSGMVQVMITDTGIGIPAGQLARIFEPFVQVDSELTRAREGTGLGLAISRDLARGMGGDLTVASQFGTGSTFTLTVRAS